MHTLPKHPDTPHEVLKHNSTILDLQNDIAFLADYFKFQQNVDFAGRMVYDDNGVEVFNFGKYKGMSVAEVLKRSQILQLDFE